MAFKHVLKSSLQPTIPLKEMAVWNDAQGSGPSVGKDGNAKSIAYKSPSSGRDNARKKGSGAPYVQINSFVLSESDIETLIIDETGLFIL